MLLGQKAAFLYLLLFFSLVIIKNKTLRFFLLAELEWAWLWLLIGFLFLLNSAFWLNVYEKHGSIGDTHLLEMKMFLKYLKVRKLRFCFYCRWGYL